MTDRALLWNLLHDGDVVEISRPTPESAWILVEIDFLEDGAGERPGSLTIDLAGCEELTFVDGVTDEVITDLAGIMAREPDVLSATEANGSIRVMCSEGELRLRYSSATLRSEDGSLMTIDDLESTSVRYWQEWERAAQGD
ncbi:MAG TPA: hypothetical protein VHL58_12280 [Thermoanaerobaculia bacterium]|nr:hypothetical protein [Thermoanaerobaculia bacterium]